ncbi:MAG: hypothetical protein LBB10_01835 [Bifidobacteriaceae bacterium]|jgi:hypothetical protein|nr:hypothetical protein [Bifidobacteriaceae bacterium]
MNVHALAVSPSPASQNISLGSGLRSKPQKLVLVNNEKERFSLKAIFICATIFIATILSTLVINITLASIAFQKTQLEAQYQSLNQEISDMKVAIDKKNAALPKTATNLGMNQPEKLVSMNLSNGQVVGLK